MYPDQPKSANKFLNKRVIIVAGILAFITVIVIVLFAVRPQVNEYSVTKTSLKTDQHFAYLHDNELYTFNGLAFSKTNLTDGTVSTLASGKRFPIPSHITWANSRGALMNFSSSFSLSEVETALAKNGEEISYDGSNSNTWYLNFTTDALTKVNDRAVTAGLAVYSEKDAGFYYVADAPNEGSATPLHFYDIEAGKDTVVSSDLEVTDLTSLQTCPEAKAVCFAARDLSDTTMKKLYTVGQSQKKKVLFETNGRIFPTNRPSQYLVVGQSPNVGEKTEGPHTEEADINEESASLYSIETKKTHTLDFKIGATSPAVHFVDDKQFYTIGSSFNNNSVYYSSELTDTGARSSLYSFTNKDGSKFADIIASTQSHGSGSFTLDTTSTNEFVLLGNQEIRANLIRKERAVAENMVNQCKLNTAQSYQYFDQTRTFRILFTADSSFAENVATFSKCLLEKDSSGLMGYSIQFGGVDPVNGRISTD